MASWLFWVLLKCNCVQELKKCKHLLQEREVMSNFGLVSATVFSICNKDLCIQLRTEKKSYSYSWQSFTKLTCLAYCFYPDIPVTDNGLVQIQRRPSPLHKLRSSKGLHNFNKLLSNSKPDLNKLLTAQKCAI